MTSTTPVPPSPAGSDSGGRRTERRNCILALIVAFVLGFLLAWLLLHRDLVPGCKRSATDDSPQQQAKGLAGSHGAADKGSGVKLGPPGGGDSGPRTSRNTTPADGGGGAAGNGAPGDGEFGHGTQWQAKGDAPPADGSSHAKASPDADGPDANRTLKDGTGPEDTHSPPPEELRADAVLPGNGTPPPAGGATPDEQAPAPRPVAGAIGNASADPAMAKDLRYDKSELPRYPNATLSASGAPALNGPKPADPNISIATIITKDDLSTVAAWYHAQLPGWSEQHLGQMVAFWPPDRKSDPRTVWLVIDPKTGQTGAILWKASKKAQ